MWQFYALGSLVAGAFEGVVDKAAFVRDAHIDSSIATFYRSIFIFFAFIAIGLVGILGELSLFFHWSIVGLALLYVVAALCYTYLLRRVEIVSIGAIAYLASFFFLFVDMYIVGLPITQTQIAGIALLVFGGLAFALDGKTHHFNRELTLGVLGALLCIFLLTTGVEAYLFKYLHKTYALNGVSFYASGWFFASIFLFLFVVGTKKTHRLLTRSAIIYIPYAIIGKIFDAFNSVLYASALALAAVSQENSTCALKSGWTTCASYGNRARSFSSSSAALWWVNNYRKVTTR